MTDYQADIARAADSRYGLTPSQLRQAQQAMWARHRVTAWQGAPIGTLTGEHVARGSMARARRIERSL